MAYFPSFFRSRNGARYPSLMCLIRQHEHRGFFCGRYQPPHYRISYAPHPSNWYFPPSFRRGDSGALPSISMRKKKSAGKKTPFADPGNGRVRYTELFLCACSTKKPAQEGGALLLLFFRTLFFFREKRTSFLPLSLVWFCLGKHLLSWETSVVKGDKVFLSWIILLEAKVFNRKVWRNFIKLVLMVGWEKPQTFLTVPGRLWNRKGFWIMTEWIFF